MKHTRLGILMRNLIAITILAGLTACDGGDRGIGSPIQPPNDSYVAGVFDPSANFRAQCANPRTGNDPETGSPFPDSQGTSIDENNWLRSWSNELYLWYSEITDVNPGSTSTPEYFDLMQTFALTPSGAPRDKFHFSMSTEEWRLLSQSGISAGYGAQFAILEQFPPRKLVVAYTEPGSPATDPAVLLVRGTSVLEVDGVDLVNANTNSEISILNAGLFPANTGELHSFKIQDPDGTIRTVSMTSANITSDPVQNVSTIATVSGNVGYMLFNDHIATSELELINAIDTLAAASVTDLVLDLRYNGGGYLILANELAFMIAGSTAAGGRVFEETKFNDQHTSFNPVTGEALAPTLFTTVAHGLSATAGTALPSLNLSRVFVLTGHGTCSASEAIMNGLRGIDIEVIQIGSTTCGKPYGFYPFDNCGTTYFSIQLKGVNEKGFGDYTDGFSPINVAQTEGTPVPGCSVADDFTHQFGDPQEALLKAALAYRVDGSCPAATGFSGTSLLSAESATFQPTLKVDVPKNAWLQNRILMP